MVLARTANTTTGCSPPAGWFRQLCCRLPPACRRRSRRQQPPSSSVPAEATTRPGWMDTCTGRKEKTKVKAVGPNWVAKMRQKQTSAPTVCLWAARFRLSGENSAGRCGPRTAPGPDEAKLSAGGIWCLTKKNKNEIKPNKRQYEKCLSTTDGGFG